MPADLTNPFSESCCAGGQCNTAQSAQSCGCDAGANHLCERHKFKAVAMALITEWRTRAILLSAELDPNDFDQTADELEAILD